MEEKNQGKVNEVFKCPTCGANLKYDIEKQGMTCEFCGTVINVAGEVSHEEKDLDFSVIDDKSRWTNEVRLSHCQNCGAEIEVDTNLLSSNCPFCNTPLVVNEDVIKGLKPDRVIPFKVSEKNADEYYRKWLKKKFFAAISVKKKIPNPSYFSTYIPSWTYDSNVNCTYKGRLGEHYQVKVGSGKNAHYETRTRWFLVSGSYSMFADDVLVCSGKSLNQEELQKMEPFNTNDSVVFDNHFLAGHSTEHYSLSVKDGWTTAKSRIMARLRSNILAKYDYDEIDYLNIFPVYDDVKYKYVTLPIWLCHYTFKKNKYKFLVNGESGKITGNYPKSPVVISLVALLIIAVVAVILYLYFTSR